MADDRGPLINGVSWTLAAFSGVVLGLRVYAKLSRHRGLWWDDYIALFSWLIQLVCVILISVNISHGFGKHATELKLSYPEVVQMSLRGAINGTMLILAAAWSKTSFAVTLLRMTKGGLKWTIIIVMVTMNAFMIASTVVNYFSCNPPIKTIDPMTPGVCWDESIHVGIDVAAAGYSAACDLFFALVPWLVLVNLQMKFKEKIGVGIAMSLGVFAAGTGIVKTVKLDNLRNEDFSYNGGDLQIWSVVEISMTLIAASIPVLRPFLRDAISSAGRYVSADASAYRNDPYGRSRSNTGGGKSQTTTSTNPKSAAGRSQQAQKQAQVGGGGFLDLETGNDSASDISAELSKIINADVRGVAFNATPKLEYELQDMNKGSKS